MRNDALVYTSCAPAAGRTRVAAIGAYEKDALVHYGCMAWKPSKHEVRTAASTEQLQDIVGNDLLNVRLPLHPDEAFSAVAAAVESHKLQLTWSPAPPTPPPKPPKPPTPPPKPPTPPEEVVFIKTVPAPDVVFLRTARRTLLY